MPSRDVLVIESHPGVGAASVTALTEAGHRVHSCHDPDSRGFPCKAVDDPTACPLDEGIDVVLVVRRVAPHPTDLEGGVTCALRAGIPVVEDGPVVLDPYERHVTARVRGDVAEACEAAAAERTLPPTTTE